MLRAPHRRLLTFAPLAKSPLSVAYRGKRPSPTAGISICYLSVVITLAANQCARYQNNETLL